MPKTIIPLIKFSLEAIIASTVQEEMIKASRDLAFLEIDKIVLQ